MSILDPSEFTPPESPESLASNRLPPARIAIWVRKWDLELNSEVLSANVLSYVVENDTLVVTWPDESVMVFSRRAWDSFTAQKLR